MTPTLFCFFILCFDFSFRAAVFTVCVRMAGMEINFFVRLPLWLVNSKIYQSLNIFTSHFYI